MPNNQVRRRVRPAAQVSPLAIIAAGPSGQLRLTSKPIGDFKPPSRNVRRYNNRLIGKLQTSIKEFGLIRPILIDQDGNIIAGVAIWMAAKELGLTEVPAIRIEHLTPEQVRLYRIADNKLATFSEFDEDALRLELQDLGDLSLNLDLELTGLSGCEIDDVVKKPSAAVEEGEDDIVPASGLPVSRDGDIWDIGYHRVLCGNSLNEESFERLLGDERAQMVMADGPYNVAIGGHVSGREDAREFAFASGEMSSEEFVDFQRTVFAHLVRFSVDGSIHYQWMSWHSAWELLTAGKQVYSELKNMLVWVKTNASRGFYRSQHELVFVFKNGTAPHICTFGIEKGARWRSNVLQGYPGCNSFGSTRDEDLADHPTVKNQILIADLIRDCSRRGGIILDPFGGAGTTLIAAEQTGRRARLIEIDPAYVDVTIRRTENRCGLGAVLQGTGQTFAEVAAERAGADVAEADRG